MTEKRFTITQKEDYFYVRDEVDKKPMGMFEFKQNEFPVYFCFHKIIDLLNEKNEKNIELSTKCSQLEKENEQLKQREETLLNEIEDFQEILTKLDKENEQLKQQGRNAIKQIREDTATIFELEEKIKELKGDVE